MGAWPQSPSAASDVRPASPWSALTPWGVMALGVVVFAVVALTRVTWIPATEVHPGVAEAYFDADHLTRVADYAAMARVWGRTGLAVGTLFVLWAAVSPTVRRWAGRVRGPRWLALTVVVLLVLAAQRVITLPFAFLAWRNRVDNGLAVDDPGTWAVDVAVGWVTGAAVTTAVVLLILGCRRRWPGLWTVVAGGILAGAVVIGSFVHPVVVEPLSHSFTPLPAGDLRTDVEEVAHAEGVAVQDVVVADASRRTQAMNAWISGFGPTRRVVLYDTMVQEAPHSLVLAVVAHELAHAGHGHVITGTALGAGGVLFAVGALGVLWRRSRRPGAGADPRAREAGSALALVAVLVVGLQLSAPVQSAVSRTMEREADRTALDATADPGAFVQAHRLLASRALADPDPPRWSQWWWGTHPTVVERLVSAESR